MEENKVSAFLSDLKNLVMSVRQSVINSDDYVGAVKNSYSVALKDYNDAYSEKFELKYVDFYGASHSALIDTPTGDNRNKTVTLNNWLPVAGYLSTDLIVQNETWSDGVKKYSLTNVNLIGHNPLVSK